MSARRFQALVNGLPLDGALARAYDPDRSGHGWDLHAELLAVVAEVIDYGNRNFIAANSKPGSPQPRALYIPRPNDNKRGQTKVGKKKIAEFMARRGVPIVRKKEQ